MKGREPHVYKKESVRWPKSEGAGKVTRISHEVSKIQMLLIQRSIITEKHYNVYKDRIGLEKMFT